MNLRTLDEHPQTLTRAAQYVRMSTEHQQYSTANQDDTILDFARRRGFEIVKTYADEGKSGLNVAGRASLQQLIDDVQCGKADFSAILVYDISRWGRFQDADESAYYEYLCKRAGIEVHYCAEPFENDGGPTSTIIKSVKRAMAGEYSRELSTKVFKGQCRLIELGYRQGGPAGFGLRRMLISQAGVEKGPLARGERKSLQTDRVILVPGPDEEVETVRWIYTAFTVEGKREAEIANELNEKGISTDLGRSWNRGTVNQVLTNEKYVGNNVYNRTSFKLKKKRVENAPEMWVRHEQAFEPVVSLEEFFVARGIIQERARKITNDELIAKLSKLADQNSRLSGQLIDACHSMPSSSVYRSRFGSLLAAYKQIGLQPDRDYRYVEINRDLRQMYPQLVSDVTSKLGAAGATVTQDSTSDLLLINGEYSASMVLSRCRQTQAGSLRWLIKLNQGVTPDITILVRMNIENTAPADYYLLPIIDIDSPKLLLCEVNGVHLDTYQFDSLEFLASASAREKVEV
ncbi:recombinase family protein [Aureliella helgolandensis]|uniref:Recombinase n=1 Tax=Aureliella helgolandensis TaxID=2527968 RepID=A0A518GBH9_9BACT|nr:recombinase family protein [Aureliella helgolandensis]QDV25890.1 Recombinase [Aureliella helgolandensis]